MPKPAPPELDRLLNELDMLSSEQEAAQIQRFFKTGPGMYGAGDRFRGIRMPALRLLARQYEALGLNDVLKLLRSDWHEERALALLIMIRQYQRGDADQRQELHALYLAHTQHINNWDLVDISAEHLVGGHLEASGIGLLRKLASSESLWERRIAILATFYFIRRDEFEPTIAVATLLVNDSHDLIHKAVGWMLREVGKREQATAEAFLRTHCRTMPRTMLRYAIERFPPPLRARYLAGDV